MMDRLADILSKSGNLIMKHSLIGILDDVVRECGFPDSVRDRIDIRLYDMFDGDSGWDLFCLEDRVEFTLNIIFEYYKSQ
jgi:hypothetical protein